MKKTLYLVAALTLLLASTGFGFVMSSELNFVLLSLLFTSLLCMIAASIADHKHLYELPLFAMTVFVHGFYLTVGSQWSIICLLIVSVLFFMAMVSLYLMIRNHISFKLALQIGLLVKLCLVPETVINFMISQASGSLDFILLSFLFLALSSAYSIFGIWMAKKEGIILGALPLVLIVLQFCFVSDILASLAALVMVLRYKPPVEPVKTPVYQKASFNRTTRKKKKV